MARKRNIFSSIDVGTSSVKVVIAEMMPDGWLNILSVGEAPTHSMCKAEPVMPDLVSDSIVIAIEQALKGYSGREKQLPGTIVANISGAFITPEEFDCEHEVPGGDCSSDAVHQMLCENARSIPTHELEDGTSYLAMTFIRSFILANGQHVLHPGGQFSETLVTREWVLRYNIDNFATMNSMLLNVLGNRMVDFWCYEPIAVASALFDITDEPKAQGLVIDIGAGVTSFTIPTMMGYLICEQIAVGCDHLVNDLGFALQLSINTCRKILREMELLHCTVVATRDGNARPVTIVEHTNNAEEISIPSAAIEIIIEARLRELFELIRKRLDDTGSMEWLNKTIYLSGDGARFPRIIELAKSVFPERDIKIGAPFMVRPCPGFVPYPRFNTAIGAIRVCHKERLVNLDKQNHGNVLQRLSGAFKRWIHNLKE